MPRNTRKDRVDKQKNFEHEGQQRSGRTFQASGRVIEAKNRLGLAGLKVEVWDTSGTHRQPLASTLTGADGAFTITLDEASLRDHLGGKRGDLYFKVYQGQQLIKTTEGQVLWRPRARPAEVVIEVDPSASADESKGDDATKHQVREFVGRVVDERTAAPVADLTVRAFDLDDGEEPKPLGSEISNARGLFAFAYTSPKKEGEDPGRHFRLEILDPKGQPIHQAEVAAPEDPWKIPEFPVRIPEEAEPESPTVTKVLATIGLEAPEGFLEKLAENGIITLADVREAGGVGHLKGLPVAKDHQVVQVLEAQARLGKWTGDEPALNQALIDKGYTSSLTIAGATLKGFAGAVKDAAPPETAAAIYTKAKIETSFFNNLMFGVGAGEANGASSKKFDVDLSPWFERRCFCADCEAAVSPLAYLADLLDYTLDHVQDDGAAIDLAFLEDTCHQPFGDLAASCEVVDTQVRQVRLCIEVLRRYLDSSAPLSPQAQAALDAAETAYRKGAYFALLAQIGTSYGEIRLARTADEETRQALAGRLGIDPDELDALFLDPSAAPGEITEAALEGLFGLVDTTRDPLAEGPVPEMESLRRDHLRSAWFAEDWPDDALPNTPPIVDPDLIGPGHFQTPLADNAAYQLWSERRAWVESQLAALSGVSDLAGLDATIEDVLGVPATDLVALEQAADQGEDIQAQLDALYLDYAALRRLLSIRRLAEAGQPVVNSEWGEVASILVQALKRGRFAQWRGEELAQGVVLGPDLFRLPEAPIQFPPPEPPLLPAWRASEAARRAWEDKLAARVEQGQAVIDGLRAAVSDVEVETLPMLRDALVEAAAGKSAARWISEHLLIDAEMDGCRVTTRVAQAIETLQNLLFSLRTGQLEDTHPTLSLETDHFEEEWQWIGSYATWRAAMLVFLYPENILQPNLRHLQTPAFQALVDETRNTPALSPEEACRLAETYSLYLQDVASLTIEATCHAYTNYRVGDSQDRAEEGSAFLFYMFARGGATGTVYWSAYDPQSTSPYAQTFWAPVPGLEKVVNLVGAVTYWIAPDKRHLFLFVRIQDDEGRKKLVFSKYDLDRRRWDSEPTGLSDPNPEGDFEVFVKQTLIELFPPHYPPHLAIRVPDGTIYARRLNRAGTSWEEVEPLGEVGGDEEEAPPQTEWKPLIGASRGSDFSSLCAMVQSDEIDPNGFCLIARTTSGGIHYRLFGPRDDGRWRPLDTGEAPVEFRGAFRWPHPGRVYVFFGNNSIGPSYQAIRWPPEAPRPDWEVLKLDKFEAWLNEVTGMSLHQLIVPESSHVDHRMSFYELHPIGSVPGVDRDYGLHAEAFVESLPALLESDPDYEPWQLVDQEVRQLTEGNLLLAEVLANLLLSRTTRFLERDSEGELSGRFPWMSAAVIGPSAGIPFESHQQLAYTRSGDLAGVYRTISERANDDQLAFGASTLTAPALPGPFDIVHQISEDVLQTRRFEIEAAFAANEGETRSNLTYLEEAYYFVPIHLALQLQRAGHYTAALDWVSTVYDYSQPLGLRKIYYGLRAEEELPEVSERAEDWLLDPLNPHAIAATRANAYTRFTLLTLVRLLVAFADAEFTRDTAESIARAHSLYLTALELLETPELDQQVDACSGLLFSLPLNADVWSGAWVHLEHDLWEVPDYEVLKNVVNQVKTIMASADPPEVQLADAYRVVEAAKAATAERTPLSTVIEERDQLLEVAYDRLRAQPEIEKALTGLASMAAQDLERTAALVSKGRSLRGDDGNGKMDWLLDGDEVSSVPDGAVKVLEELNLARSRAYQAGKSEVDWSFAAMATFDPSAAIKVAGQMRAPKVPKPAYRFCIPPNPMVDALRQHAELNLYKIHTCRNIAGLERVIEPYAAPTDVESGLPSIGAGGQLLLPGAVELQPTPYRYQALLGRAKELVALAQQIEGAYLAALEKRDAEAYNLLKARQDVQISRQTVHLYDLRVREARHDVDLARLQQERAELQAKHYQTLLRNPVSFLEAASLEHMLAAVGHFHVHAAIRQAATFGIGGIGEVGSALSATSSLFQMMASFERRSQEWELQLQLAGVDVRIGTQQALLAQDRVRIVGQEREIALLQADHAQATVDFLVNKFTNVELYDWMSRVLEGVYRFFLQQATAMAQLAANQLAFERQEVPLPFIQPDYWEPPVGAVVPGEEGPPERRGLTGSARLLRDIHALDQYAFETGQRKLQLTETISLAQLAPAEFQRFRETGVMPFATPMELFDRDFPGHYLRLIKRVRTSVVALIPPTQGIHATLSTSGISRVVIGGDRFETVVVNRPPDSVALSSPREATGLFELQPQPQPEMLLPFEGLGVDTTWEFRMPKPANLFDYSTIADVLITIEYTALDSFAYRQQVIQALDNQISADRPFSFRHQFADQWYDLNNPELTAEPMVVRFSTRREDFPPNLDDLTIQHVALYFSRADGVTFEVPVTHLHFAQQDGTGAFGGGAVTIDGIVSTRRGNAGDWTDMQGKSPFGEWELALLDNLPDPDGRPPEEAFQNEEIEDILLVITYSGRTPEWPA